MQMIEKWISVTNKVVDVNSIYMYDFLRTHLETTSFSHLLWISLNVSQDKRALWTLSGAPLFKATNVSDSVAVYYGNVPRNVYTVTCLLLLATRKPNRRSCCSCWVAKGDSDINLIIMTLSPYPLRQCDQGVSVWLGVKLINWNQLKTQTQHSEPSLNPVHQWW